MSCPLFMLSYQLRAEVNGREGREGNGKGEQPLERSNDHPFEVP